MKFSNTVITLLVILFSSLLIGTFLGFTPLHVAKRVNEKKCKYQEGITYNKLTVLEDILTKTNTTNSDKMNAVKTLKIEDEDFINVIDSELPDDEKIEKIKSLLRKLLKTDISGKTYANALSTNITINP